MSKQNIIYIWVSFLFFIMAFLFVYPAEDAMILFEYSKTFEWKNVLEKNYIPAIKKVIERWS